MPSAGRYPDDQGRYPDDNGNYPDHNGEYMYTGSRIAGGRASAGERNCMEGERQQ